MKNIKSITATLLASALLITALPFSAFAQSENTPKQEVIYVNINSDGSVDEINAVNIFSLDFDGEIIDYGKYSSLRNMTTTDKIEYSGQTVTINAKSGKLYYEGKLESKEIPWDISIRYYIDGKEYKADEIAGKSGKLKIKMKITDNTKCDGNFFEGYALQATVTLDTEKCSNIRADGATFANVGSDKQLTYTILPNKGGDFEISADVKDFEMSAISINGVKLNLNIEVDDTQIRNKIDKIINAVNDLDNGAGKINDGTSKLYDGTNLLNGKSEELYSGVSALANGASDLSGALKAITSKNGELTGGVQEAFEGLCSASETILNAELSKNGLPSVKLTPKTYSKVLSELLKTVNSDNVYDIAYKKALAEVTKQVDAQADTLYSGYIDSEADMIYQTYIRSQADGIYAQVAAQAVLEQLVLSGYTSEQASAFLQTAEGKALISLATSAMTDEQKEKIITAAVQNLTEEQKTQIKAGAVASLTDEQKKQIKDGYIGQVMKSKEVTDKIYSAVSEADEAAASIVKLKGQLDNFSLLCDGVKSYTSAVSSVADGAQTLKINMDSLCKNVGKLKTSIGELNSGANSLYDGTAELKDGTGEFVSETSGIDKEVSDEIDSLISSVSGDDVKITSFVSEKNTNIDSVQFVIKTEPIKIAEQVKNEPVASEKLNFWQKLLRLFGLY